MDIPVSEIMKTLAAELRNFARTETVVGAPIQAGDSTIVPVVAVSIGFGAGAGGSGAAGGEKPARPGAGGGGGGGATVRPVAFLVVRGDDVRLLPIKQGAVGGLIEAIPSVIDKLVAKGKAGKGQPTEDKPSEPAPEAPPSEGE